jgi:HPt (histidine-containing phosphotransfer) domain-containing protein
MPKAPDAMDNMKNYRDLPRREPERPPSRARILTISDVDADIGLLNAGGNLRVYRDILSDFCRDAEVREERIRRAALDGNAALYIILLYALKDASAVIGATELARCAIRLADAAKNENPAEMREKTDALLRSKRLLTERILAALKQQTPPGESRAIAPKR